jgi:hypothetical protein
MANNNEITHEVKLRDIFSGTLLFSHSQIADLENLLGLPQVADKQDYLEFLKKVYAELMMGIYWSNLSIEEQLVLCQRIALRDRELHGFTDQVDTPLSVTSTLVHQSLSDVFDPLTQNIAVIFRTQAVLEKIFEDNGITVDTNEFIQMGLLTLDDKFPHLRNYTDIKEEA